MAKSSATIYISCLKDFKVFQAQLMCAATLFSE